MIRLLSFIPFLLVWLGLGTILPMFLDTEGAMITFGGIMYLYAKAEDWILYLKGEHFGDR